MSSLNQVMQARLDKWRKHTLPAPSTEKIRSRIPSGYIGRQDYGDDIRDYEKKDMEAWQNEQQRNPMYRS